MLSKHYGCDCSDFSEIFPNLIRNATDKKWIGNIKNVVLDCFSRFGSRLDIEIKKIEKQFGKFSDFQRILNTNSIKADDIHDMKDILIDFENVFEKEYKNKEGDRGKGVIVDTALSLFRFRLGDSIRLVEKRRSETRKSDREVRIKEEKKFDSILELIDTARFCDRLLCDGQKNVVILEVYESIFSLSISGWKEVIKEKIQGLNENLLETKGKKKADLLSKLEQTIQDRAPFFFWTRNSAS